MENRRQVAVREARILRTRKLTRGNRTRWIPQVRLWNDQLVLLDNLIPP